MLQTLLSQLRHPELWSSALEVATINLMLSGDNVVAITLAARELPPRQRRWGVTLGAGAAVILTVLLAAVASILMEIPYLKFVGGLALLYVAYKLATNEPSAEATLFRPDGVLRAARVIAVATLVMSLDNVLAIAAAAHGNTAAIALGLGVSIPFAIFGANLLSALLNRFPALLLVGAGLLGWIAGGLIAEDAAATTIIASLFGPVMARELDAAIPPAAALFVIVPHSGRWLRSRWELTTTLASWLRRHPGLNGPRRLADTPHDQGDPERRSVLGDPESMQTPPELVAEPGDNTVTVSHRVDAPRERVFEAWTEPEHIERWLGLEDFSPSVFESDLKVGGKWRLVFRAPDGRFQAVHGEYLEIRAPERIVQAVYYDAAPHIEAVETLHFDETGREKTILTSTTEHQSVENRDWHLASGAEDGAAQVLDRLTRYLEDEQSRKSLSQHGR